MVKRFISSITISLLMLFFLSGCSQSLATNTPKNDSKSVTIATSFYPMYIMALNIAKGLPDVKVINMTQATTGCLHDYAVTPDDMKNLENANYLMVNGAGMESFMDKVIAQMPNLKIIEASKGIPIIKGDGELADNPHLWVSVTNCILQVRNIEEQLSRYDAADPAQYKANADAYVNRLEALKSKMHKILDKLPNREIITFHEAFPYFAQEFALNIAGVIEREPGSEPSARELADTISIINKLKIKALFAEPQYSAEAAETIAHETGAKVYTLDPAVNGPDDADAYINIMESNLNVLWEALK